MAAAAILKNKNSNIFATDWLIVMKFGMKVCLGPHDPFSQ